MRVVSRSENCPSSRRSQMFSQPASDAAWNSASEVDNDVEFWRRERQLMGPPRDRVLLAWA